MLGLCISRPVAAETLLILGDSLSAGYRLTVEASWPHLLQQHYQQSQKNITIINASVSGHTSSQSLPLLSEQLKQHQPRWVLIELGANNGLQGLSLETLEHDLSKIITQVQEANARPILMQIRIPPNYGKRYTEAFAAIYPRVAKQYGIPLVPFFMEEVVLEKSWLLDDQIHPNSIAQPFIAKWVADELDPYLNEKR